MRKLILLLTGLFILPCILLAGKEENVSILRDHLMEPSYQFAQSENPGKLILFLIPPSERVLKYEIKVDDKPSIFVPNYRPNGVKAEDADYYNRALNIILDPGLHRLTVSAHDKITQLKLNPVSSEIQISSKKTRIFYFKSVPMFPCEGKLVEL